MEDLDFARVRSSPAAPFAAGTAVVAASPEQPTRMELDPDTAARLKDLDMVAVFTMTPCEQAVDAAAASRDLQIDQ